jgi:DDE superfamily endonuclease
MPTLSPEILPLLAVFAPAMTAPTFANLQVLVTGVILAPGRRTVASALRAVGLERGANFSKYHRFFSQAHWRPRQLSRLLLALLIRCFVAPGVALQLIADETVERRRGKMVEIRGLFRDAVRSTASRITYCWGIRWLCICLLVEVPWSRRPWALPFLLIPVHCEKACERIRSHHRTLTQVTAIAVEQVRRWQPERDIVVVGDGSYAAVPLVLHCQQLRKPVVLVSRLRLDAVLHHPPGARPKGKRGPKPKKGARQESLEQRLADPKTAWQKVCMRWYGGEDREVEIATGTALWYRPGQAPAPIRWVLVRSQKAEKGRSAIQAGACFCSDPDQTPEQILTWFVARWNIEVTFEEIRAHLGFETQRHWSRRAVERVTPCLFGLFSLVVVFAKALHPETIPLAQSAWYDKEEATFSDALAAVRRRLWGCGKYMNSPPEADHILIPRALWLRIQQVACYAA